MNARAFVLTVVVAALPISAHAQTVRHVPAGRHAAPAMLRAPVRPQGRFHPIRLGPHTFYGTITSISGNSLTLRTRHQRVVSVDATTVLADGTYSAPLFVGKLVTIDGDQGSNGIFTAAHISRMTNLNALPNDH